MPHKLIYLFDENQFDTGSNIGWCSGFITLESLIHFFGNHRKKFSSKALRRCRIYWLVPQWWPVCAYSTERLVFFILWTTTMS